jgi:hypothetical protein
MILTKTKVPRRAALSLIAGAGAVAFGGKTFAADPIKVGFSSNCIASFQALPCGLISERD